MIQIRKEENQKKQKEKKLKVYKVNTHKKTVIALWVLLAMSFLFAVYKNFTAIDIHTVHETKVIEEQSPLSWGNYVPVFVPCYDVQE